MTAAQHIHAEGMADTVIDLDRLVAMANQIGDFFAPYPPERSAEGIRNHLRTYWDPRMRQALLDHVGRGAAGLNERVIAGARLLLEPQAQQKGYYGPPKA